MPAEARVVDADVAEHVRRELLVRIEAAVLLHEPDALELQSGDAARLVRRHLPPHVHEGAAAADALGERLAILGGAVVERAADAAAALPGPAHCGTPGSRSSRVAKCGARGEATVVDLVRRGRCGPRRQHALRRLPAARRRLSHPRGGARRAGACASRPRSPAPRPRCTRLRTPAPSSPSPCRSGLRYNALNNLPRSATITALAGWTQSAVALGATAASGVGAVGK